MTSQLLIADPVLLAGAAVAHHEEDDHGILVVGSVAAVASVRDEAAVRLRFEREQGSAFRLVSSVRVPQPLADCALEQSQRVE